MDRAPLSGHPRVYAVGAIVVIVLAGILFWRHQYGPTFTVENWSDRSAQISPDGRSVRVAFTVGACGNPRSEARVSESDSEVEVTVVTKTDHVFGGCTDIGIPLSVIAQFRRPLGDRRLVDGHCRHPEWGDTYACPPG